MAVLSGDYIGCSVFIYDEAGNELGNTTVTSFDKNTLWLKVKRMPPTLYANDVCRLLILTAPAPREYHGRVLIEGTGKTIGIYKGKEKESRKTVRYKVNFPAQIENLIYDEKACPLHTPIEVRLINISKSGVRFRAPFYSLFYGAKFQMRMKINDSEKLLIAVAINHMDKNSETTEYGCRFLVGSEEEV